MNKDKLLTDNIKETISRLKIILTDPDEYLRGNLEDLIINLKELNI